LNTQPRSLGKNTPVGTETLCPKKKRKTLGSEERRNPWGSGEGFRTKHFSKENQRLATPAQSSLEGAGKKKGIGFIPPRGQGENTQQHKRNPKCQKKGGTH